LLQVSGHPILWTPSAERIEAATLTHYQRWLAETRGVDTGSYEELWQWSVTELESFWASVVEYFDLRFDRTAEHVLGDRTMPGAQWFPGSKISYAEHIFRDRDDSRVAIRHASEIRPVSEWSWARLKSETAAIAAGLRAAGVTEGDRVVAYMPNIPETIAAFLACASIGAIWSAAAPEFGSRTVIDRFSQIEPKVMLAVDGYRYGGKDFDRTDTVAEIAAAIPSAPRVITFGYLDGSGWEAGFLKPGELTFAALPFEHPLWVLYSSGTTGLPKPIVHSQGGILLEHVKALGLQVNAQPEDRVFWFTTTGWMMWNFLVGVLLSEASIVLFDGNPAYPDMGTLWDLAQETGITTFGTSAAFISGCIKAGIHPTEGRDLSALKAVGSTGSPLSEAGFKWVYDELGADTWLFSTSGGTDMCTAFVGGVPTLPVRSGELQARALGSAVEAWNERGEPVIGEMGELVITEPMPSMPVFFWGDQDGERYRDSYFSMFPGVWRHGDWLELTPEGGAVIHGRSDSTINRGGVRIGTSEIYSAVLSLDQVLDALVVDLPQADTDGRMELFVVLRPGSQLSDELIQQIRRRLREDCSPRHLPDAITQIAEAPRTLSGKLLEVPVKRILMGTPAEQAASRESLANPAALDPFIAMARA
jgi:acetoacetyl-CoA synthetase